MRDKGILGVGLEVVSVFLSAFLVSLLLPAICTAQIASSARVLATGGQAVGLSGDVGSLLSNPAGVSKLARPGFHLAHRYYNHQPDVSAQTFLVSVPIHHFHLSTSYKQYGLPDAYRDSEWSFYFGRRFGPNMRIAMGFHSQQILIPGYVDERFSGLSMHAQFDVGEYWTVGVGWDGLSLSGGSGEAGLLGRQALLKVGGLYQFSESVWMVGDVVYEQGGHVLLQGGLEYQLVADQVFIRLGLSSVGGTLPAAGFGVALGRFRFDLGSTIHAQLGISPQFDLSVFL